MNGLGIGLGVEGGGHVKRDVVINELPDVCEACRIDQSGDVGPGSAIKSPKVSRSAWLAGVNAAALPPSSTRTTYNRTCPHTARQAAEA